MSTEKEKVAVDDEVKAETKKIKKLERELSKAQKLISEYKEKEIYYEKLRTENLNLIQLVEEDRHLATTVEAKDAEIINLQKDIRDRDEVIESLTKNSVDAKELAQKYDKLVVEFNTLVEFLTEYLSLIQLNITQSTSSIQLFTKLEKTLRDKISKGEE